MSVLVDSNRTNKTLSFNSSFSSTIKVNSSIPIRGLDLMFSTGVSIDIDINIYEYY